MILFTKFFTFWYYYVSDETTTRGKIRLTDTGEQWSRNQWAEKLDLELGLHRGQRVFNQRNTHISIYLCVRIVCYMYTYSQNVGAKNNVELDSRVQTREWVCSCRRGSTVANAVPVCATYSPPLANVLLNLWEARRLSWFKILGDLQLSL